jgi:hypothetical protein
MSAKPVPGSSAWQDPQFVEALKSIERRRKQVRFTWLGEARRLWWPATPRGKIPATSAPW